MKEFTVRLDISFTVSAETEEEAIEAAIYEAKSSGLGDFGYEVEELEDE